MYSDVQCVYKPSCVCMYACVCQTDMVDQQLLVFCLEVTFNDTIISVIQSGVNLHGDDEWHE